MQSYAVNQPRLSKTVRSKQLRKAQKDILAACITIYEAPTWQRQRNLLPIAKRSSYHWYPFLTLRLAATSEFFLQKWKGDVRITQDKKWLHEWYIMIQYDALTCATETCIKLVFSSRFFPSLFIQSICMFVPNCFNGLNRFFNWSALKSTESILTASRTHPNRFYWDRKCSDSNTTSRRFNTLPVRIKVWPRCPAFVCIKHPDCSNLTEV